MNYSKSISQLFKPQHFKSRNINIVTNYIVLAGMTRNKRKRSATATADPANASATAGSAKRMRRASAAAVAAICSSAFRPIYYSHPDQAEQNAAAAITVDMRQLVRKWAADPRLILFAEPFEEEEEEQRPNHHLHSDLRQQAWQQRRHRAQTARQSPEHGAADSLLSLAQGGP